MLLHRTGLCKQPPSSRPYLVPNLHQILFQTPRASASAVSATSEREAAGSVDLVASSMQAELCGSPASSGRLLGSKRTVALHVCYVGSSFQGLQVVREQPPDKTVEGVLERALLQAGLIAPSNYGDLFKIGWTRSSRTDKGVHSISTVIGVRVVLQDGDSLFEQDPEGLGLAARINTHLPASVRVVSAQRVNKKFNARRGCWGRSYEYYLPVGLLHMKGDGSQQDEQRMSLLRAALSKFVGRHAFHNYTPKAVRNIPSNAELLSRAQRTRAAKNAAREAALQQNTQEAGGASVVNGTAAAAAAELSPLEPQPSPSNAADSAGKQAGQQEAQPAGMNQPAGADADDVDMTDAATRGRRADESDEGEGEGGGLTLEQELVAEYGAGSSDGAAGGCEETTTTAADGQQAGEAGSSEGIAGAAASTPKRWNMQCEWVEEMGQPGKLHPRLFRTVETFTADDPGPLVPGGRPCVRLYVSGDSFLLNQIRHMIAAAVAVARGQLSLELLEASLTAPAQIKLPKVPPHTLLLAGCKFPPFRGAGTEEPLVARFSGESLQLRAGGAANLQLFRDQALSPALNDLLQTHPDWELFDQFLPRFYWPPEAAEQVIKEHKAWKAKREEAAAKRRQREEEQAARAAADAARATGVPETAAEGMSIVGQ